MIDLTLSDEDNEQLQTPHAYDSEKENVKPSKKRPFERHANDMMPDLNRKMSADEHQAFETGLGTSRYTALKKTNPFFTHQQLVDVTSGCDEIKTIQFCQEHGLIAKEQVCENCLSFITKPWFEHARNQWWWVCTGKPKGKKPCNNFKFSIKKGTYLTRVTLVSIRCCGWSGIL